MKNRNAAAEPELSRPLRVEKISPNGVEETIVASERERQALAKRFDLVEIAALEASLTVVPKQTGLDILVTGSVAADVVQRCVVTLELLPARVEQEVEAHFVAPALLGDSSERALDEDDMEPIADGVIDLGELVAQNLGLALDPYPRKPGLPPLEAAYGHPPRAENPFAALIKLRDKNSGR